MRLFKGVRDRVVRIVTGILGPPLAALRRVLAAFRDRFDTVVERVLTWWANVWGKAEKDDKVDLGKPSIACPLLAAFALAVAMYSWPSWEHLQARWFYPWCLAIWLVAFVSLRAFSLPHREGNASAFLREAGQRPGLVWWERFGALVALVLLWFSRFEPHLLPLAAATTFGFGRLLVTKYRLRILQRMAPGLVGPSSPPDATDSDQYAERSFHWTVRAGVLADDHSLTISVHLPTYRQMQADNPEHEWDAGVPRFDKWIVDGSTAEVDRAARALRQISTDRHYSTFAEISNVLALVQSIDYSLDEDTTRSAEYWRFPIETVHDETGDCEDTTILAAAVLRRLGHRVGTMLMPEHVALAVEAPQGTPGDFIVHDGRPMYYCETTSSGWRVGEFPRADGAADPVLHMIER